MISTKSLTDKRLLLFITMLVFIALSTGAISLYMFQTNGAITNHNVLEFCGIWVISIFSIGLTIFNEIQNKSWRTISIMLWSRVRSCIFIPIILWMLLRINNGFEAIAYLLISCLTWGACICPLLLGMYLYKKFYPSQYPQID